MKKLGMALITVVVCTTTTLAVARPPVRPAAQRGVGGAIKPPTAVEIAQALTDSSIKYTGGRPLLATQGIVSPYGGWGYYIRRTVTNLSCRPIASRSFSCSYHVLKEYQAWPDSLWGSLQVATKPNQESDVRRTVIRTGSGWTMPETDRINAEYARNQSANRGSSATDEAAAILQNQMDFDQKQRERERKLEECQREALLNGEMAFCNY